MNAKVTYGYPLQFKHSRWLAWQRLAAYWPEYISQDTFHCSAQLKVLETALKHLQPAANTCPSLVDLGCGTGLFLKTVRSRALSRWERLVGLDFCPDMLRLAGESDVSDVPRLRFFEVDLESPIENILANHLRDFDVATATFLLDEIEDIDTCFASAASMIRPGGHLTCGTLDYDREMQRHSAHIEPTRKQDKALVISNTLPGHRSLGEYFRVVRETEEFDQHAERHGFRLVENIVMSPSDLHSRADGPALRLLSWRMAAK